MYIPGTTCLHIPLAHPCLYYYLLSPQYTVLHILFYCTFLNLYLCIFSCVVLHILHCPLSGPDLIYISLLIIFCIIEYVTNKRTLTLTCRGLKTRMYTKISFVIFELTKSPLKYLFIYMIPLMLIKSFIGRGKSDIISDALLSSYCICEACNLSTWARQMHSSRNMCLFHFFHIKHLGPSWSYTHHPAALALVRCDIVNSPKGSL